MPKSNLVTSQKNSTRNTRWVARNDADQKINKTSSSYYENEINPKSWKRL